METRSIWLKTLDGTPKEFAWAAVKTPGEEPDAAKKAWATALTSQEGTGDGWDATMTSWRDVPMMLWGHFLVHGSATPTLSGRTVAIDGVSFDLDTSGAPPETTITDIDALCTLVEAVGDTVSFTEVGGKTVKVYTSEPDTPLDGCDSAIYRQTSDSQVVRTDA
jgi:hypothetical protein